MPGNIQSGSPLAWRGHRGVQRCPGKLGELLQGVDHQGNPLLFTNTVTSSPYVTVAEIRQARSFGITCPTDPAKPTDKTRRAITRFTEEWGFHFLPDLEVILRNSPPEAKGLGSSSVDTAVAMLAVADELKIPALPEQMYRIQCGIERSDYLFAPDRLVRANPVTGEHQILGPAPRAVLVGWDTARLARVETAAVAHLDRQRARYACEYATLEACLTSGDPDGIRYACTRSAEINQLLLPKPGFDWAHALATSLGVGLIAAHTGTYLAFAVFAPADAALVGELIRQVTRHGGTPEISQTGGAE